jgi:transposase
LETVGVTFFYLPPYAPELNAIEPFWRRIKYEDLPVRSFSAAEALKAAVDGVLDDHVQRVAQSTLSLCAAA